MNASRLPPLLPALALVLAACPARTPPRLEQILIPSPSLAGSLLPEGPQQPALVALPPGYHESGRRYPVVYYLPGFTTDVTEYVDGTFEGFHLGRALDAHVAAGHAPLVVVVVNGRNALGGSFYVNSPVTGRWEDYVVRDAVAYVEGRYRVGGRPACRGLAGDSMGGFGALNLAMRHPDVFGAVFAESPLLWDEHGLEDYGLLTPAYAAAWRLQGERMRGWPPGEAPQRLIGLSRELFAAEASFPFDYRRGVALAYGAAFAPAPEAGPPFVDWPRGGGDPGDAQRVARLRAGVGDLEGKLERYAAALRSLRGLQLDVGRNDPLALVPRGARRFSELLQEAGVPHELTEHDGGHVDRLAQRYPGELLPFFSRALCGGES